MQEKAATFLSQALDSRGLESIQRSCLYSSLTRVCRHTLFDTQLPDAVRVSAVAGDDFRKT